MTAGLPKRVMLNYLTKLSNELKEACGFPVEPEPQVFYLELDRDDES